MRFVISQDASLNFTRASMNLCGYESLQLWKGFCWWYIFRWTLLYTWSKMIHFEDISKQFCFVVMSKSRIEEQQIKYFINRITCIIYACINLIFDHIWKSRFIFNYPIADSDSFVLVFNWILIIGDILLDWQKLIEFTSCVILNVLTH